MAIHAVSLIAICFLATSAAYQPCGVGQCKVAPVRGDLVVKFQQLASEKDVRLVYFNLEFGNDSFHPLESNERFLAKRWIWAKTIREPMLHMTNNEYDVYSLGLLTRQKRYMSVRLKEQPTGCLTYLNTSCQDNVVGEMLLGNVTAISYGNHLPQDNCVCTMRKQHSSGEEGKPLCCSVQKIIERNDTIVRCGIALENDWFVKPFTGIFVLLLLILFLYSPAIPLLIPGWFFNLKDEYEKEKKLEQQLRHNRVSPNEQDIEMTEIGQTSRQTTQLKNDTEDENSDILAETDSEFEDNSSAHHEDQELSKLEIPVDDDSPITVRDLLKNYIIEELPLIPMNFNLKLFLLFFVLFPFFLHLKLAVILFYNQEYHQEAYRKHENCKEAGGQLFDVCFMAQFEWQAVLSNWHIIAAPAYVLLLVVCAFIRPKDLLYRKGSAKTVCIFSLCNSPSLGQEMVEHLKAQRQGVYLLFFFMPVLYMKSLMEWLMKLTLRGRTGEPRRRRALRFLCVFLCVFPGLIIGAALSVIFIMILLVALFSLIFFLSPYATFIFFTIRKLKETEIALAKTCYKHIGSSSIRLTSFAIFVLTFTMVSFMMYITLTISVTFMTQTVLFTIMGLALNYEFATPYVVFILVVAGNIYLCYSNLQSRYKEIKCMISKYWKEETRDSQCITCSDNRTIPKELFWWVTDDPSQILPWTNEVCCMLRDMALIVFFLCLSFLAISTFKNLEDISALVSTFFVFISGVIPTLIFKRFTANEKFSGWNKIIIDNKIKEAVHEYVTYLSRSSEITNRPSLEMTS